MRDRSESGLAGLGWRRLSVFAAFAAIALFFLLSEHRAHALGLLPFLLFAACPLLHMFMHGGHGHGGHGRRAAAPPDAARGPSVAGDEADYAHDL